jgi:acetylglutamate kinase
MQNRVLEWPRWVKRLVVIGLDVVLALFATWIAFALRLDYYGPPVGAQWWVYLLASTLFIPIFVRFGLYRAIFRYTGQAALQTTAWAVLAYGCILLVVLLWTQWPWVPRTLGVLQPLIFLLLLVSSRAVARVWLAGQGRHGGRLDGRLLVYGAGTAGVQTASALRLSHQYALLGFVDDDPAKAGRSLNGIPVFSPTDISRVIARQGVTDILLALPSVSRDRRNAILQSLAHLPVHVRTLPGLTDLASGRVTVQDFHELDLEDLLGRDPVPPDLSLLARDLTGQVVLVTGAGGSIGSELTRQIVRQRPRQLLLLDHHEFGLYSIHQELLELLSTEGLAVTLVPLLGSIGNPARLETICATYRPDTVYHAAAYKHVPMVEDNPGEGGVEQCVWHLERGACSATSPRQGRNPGPGAALHPQVPRQDHGHQVRRQRHDRPGLQADFAEDVVLLKLVGMNPVVVHGGGPQIETALNRLGKKGTFIQGMRVTDAETMEVVEWVLAGEVQQDIVGLINQAGGKAVGLTGRDGGMIRARKLKMVDNKDPSIEHDVGQVGDIVSIDPSVVKALQDDAFIPVISPIGFGENNESYNINADVVASKLATVLKAEKLMLLTNTPGVLDKAGNLLTDLTARRIDELFADGTISGGMLPKIAGALDAAKSGVNAVHIIDGRVPHAMLLEILTDQAYGTMIRRCPGVRERAAAAAHEPVFRQDRVGLAPVFARRCPWRGLQHTGRGCPGAGGGIDGFCRGAVAAFHAFGISARADRQA